MPVDENNNEFCQSSRRLAVCFLGSLLIGQYTIMQVKYQASPSQNVIKAWFQLNVVLVNVVIEVFGSQNLCYPHQLQKASKTQFHKIPAGGLSSECCDQYIPDRSCHDHGRKAPSWRSCSPTYSQGSTYPDCSHTSETNIHSQVSNIIIVKLVQKKMTLQLNDICAW